MTTTAAKPPRISLSRDFSALLVELSIALHKHAMYPSGHPSLPPADAAVVRRAERLLEDRTMLALGVARRQLIIEGVATDPNQPVLRRLAEALHRHHLGAVTISRGIAGEEIGAALTALAADPALAGPIGLRGADVPAWGHIRLHPLTFDRLTLAAEPLLTPPGSHADGADAWRGAELWIGLARAAMAGDAAATEDVADDDAPAPPIEPAIVAHAIDEHPRAEAYDQVIVGYLLQIARELKESGGADSAALRRRTARLIAALNPETLRRLVDMGGNVAQRKTFVLDAAHGMAVDAVLQILKAASDVSGQTISQGLVRMLSKLASHAETGSDDTRPLADEALREQVTRLLSGWQLTDPNPSGYRHLLQRVTTQAPVDTSAATARHHRPEPVRVAQMSLEIGGSGPLLDRAVDRAVEDGTVRELLDLQASLPADADATAQAILRRLCSSDAIARLLGRDSIDFESLDRLLPHLPVDSFNPLLDALSTSDSRATRRRLLDRLAQTGRRDITSLITSRLYDDHWFVQRNMLMLLERSGLAHEGFSASAWTDHLDVRVRRQAIRLQLTLPHERDQALAAALRDTDPRIVHLGLAALQDTWPDDLASRVVELAEDPHVAEPQRVLAVEALGRCRARAALITLLRIADGGTTLLGRPKLPPTSPLLLAALRAMGTGWTDDTRTATLLALARRSSDPQVRTAAAPRRR